jgi:murein DD-endopeptidase MepM/ murein hydrolase activator NlpD
VSAPAAPRELFSLGSGWDAARPLHGAGGTRRAPVRALTWPVSPVFVTSPFGERAHPVHGESQFHAGVDLWAEEAQPIYAPEAGAVVFSGWNGGYGNCIEVRHGPALRTRFAHLQEPLVVTGETVRRGQLLGLVGMTGLTTGPHLHFEVRFDDVPVDPEHLLSPPLALSLR